MRRSDYTDHVMLATLNQLHEVPDGLRFTELKAKLNVSDTSLVNRLNKLREAGYVTMDAKPGKKGRSYIAYVLTPSGIELVLALNISTLLETVENQFAT